MSVGEGGHLGVLAPSVQTEVSIEHRSGCRALNNGGVSKDQYNLVIGGRDDVVKPYGKCHHGAEEHKGAEL